MRLTLGLPFLVSEVCFSLALILATPSAEAASSQAPVRINCGGGVYTDSLGQVWTADNSFVGGSVKAYSSSKFVAGTNDDKLFQSERFAQTLIYQIPLANGTYDVTLNFAEMYWSAAGKRVFSLSLEGQTVIQDLDIWATVGQYAALQRTFSVAVNDGVLDIVGTASVDNAQLSAIEVKPRANPTPTPTPTPTPVQTVRINAGGPAYTDSTAQAWTADSYFANGSVATYSATVSGTSDPTLYQTERFAKNLTYHIPVSNGNCEVTLYFAENYFSAAGKRVFSLSLEGQTVIQDLDIWATVGQYAALQQTFGVAVNDGVLDIVGAASVDNAQLSAIEVKPNTNPTPTPTPTPVAFRIAISEDGNWHDRDDICSAAMNIAQLALTGNQSRLVHFDYADHYWITDIAREELMRVSSVETAKLWGGFNLSVFYNSTQLRSLAVSHLAAEINKSTATDQLRILGMGPMQTIGLAVAQSDPTKLQYVTLVSHSIWNDTHATKSGPGEGLSGPAYSYSNIGAMGVNLLHIIDQNAGLSKPYNQYYWLRDSTDPKLRWLWDRGQAAAKSTFDCSDAGETYFILTGDQNCTPLKLKVLLTGAP